MKFINQNSAVLSLSSALDPSYAVIDGRKEIDRLKFLTDFSSLINFYDQENKINVKKIIDIEDNSVLIKKDIVPISRSKKSDLMKHLDLLKFIKF